MFWPTIPIPTPAYQNDYLSFSVASVAGVTGLTAAMVAAAIANNGSQLTLTPGLLFDPLSTGQKAQVVINYTMQDAAGSWSSAPHARKWRFRPLRRHQ